MKISKLALILFLLIAQNAYTKNFSDTTKTKKSIEIDSQEVATGIDLIYAYEKYKGLDSLNNILIQEWRAKYQEQKVYSDTLEAIFTRKETAWNGKFLAQANEHKSEIRRKNIYLGVSVALNVVQFIAIFKSR